jgi:aryl-alcohol dehydrogenase-like predicted oxidoreductase
MRLPEESAAASRLSLGTVQFGLPYGVANTGGQVDETAAHEILRLAQEHGIRSLDTASSYGSSESIIGAFGSESWRITTKLAALPGDCEDVAAWVEGEIRGSLQRLDATAVHAVLLHRPDDLLGANGDRLHEALNDCRKQGLFHAQGVSLYSTDDLERFIGRFHIDAVQLPFNILDRKLVAGGHARALRDLGIEVQVRSIFLQGLLLLPLAEQLRRFPAGEAAWRTLAEWTSKCDITPYEACVRFALGQVELDAIIVGMDSIEHLAALLDVAAKPPLDAPASITCADADVIDPRRWQ